jgi:hypothetical protein
MRDNRRVIEKSRMPIQDSKRRRLSISTEMDEQSNVEDNEGEEGHGYDLEVYDDRPFYSLLLKVFSFALWVDRVISSRPSFPIRPPPPRRTPPCDQRTSLR